MGSSGSSAPVTTQTKNQDPWSGAQPMLSQMFQTAQQYQQNAYGYQPFTGETQAPLDPTLASAMSGITGLAQGQIANPQGVGGAPGLGTALTDLGQAGQGYQQLYQQNIGTQNPYLQDVINQQMNQVQAAMSGAGRYGSGANQAGIARAIAPTLAQDYLQRQGIAGQALGGLGQTAQAIPGLMQAQYLPYQQLTQVGQFQQQRAQDELNAQINLYNAQQAYPWQELERESAILAGAGQLGGTTVTGTTTQVPFTQRLLGGGLAGAGLGGAIGGPFGAGLGALGGGLLGGFL